MDSWQRARTVLSSLHVLPHLAERLRAQTLELFSQHILIRAYYVPGAVLGTGETAVPSPSPYSKKLPKPEASLGPDLGFKPAFR